jgi:hypothetical protein
MDFSCAGYRAGGVRLPDAPAVKTLTPLEGDNTPQIQAAIDEVSTRTPDANRLRGPVALRPGDYRVDGTVTIEADFFIAGTQILLDRCSVDGEGTWPVATQASVTGPDVVLNFSDNAHAGVSPHQRWATGLLVDGARLPDTVARTPGIAFSNRKTAGSGHGWDIGWAVAWNVASPHPLVQRPPGAMNWCIGCSGELTKAADSPEGIYDSPGRAVEPVSLYLEQLRERLGDAALVNIGIEVLRY